MACILYAISLTMALQHAGAPNSLAFGKWKRSHSGNALSKSKLDLSRNATRGKKWIVRSPCCK